MKVCFISFEYPPEILGGAGIYAESIVKGLKRRGVDLSVITRGDQNDRDSKIYRIQTPHVSYLRRILFMKSSASLLNELNKQLKFDLVHFNEPLLMSGLKLNLPVVCSIHATQINEIVSKLADLRTLASAKTIMDLVLKSPVGSICDFFTARATDKIICPSPHLAKLVESHFSVDEQKICVIPNGIDLKAFDEITEYDSNILSKYDLERNGYLLFMGRLDAIKGVQHLIKAFRQIKEEYANLKLVIVGTGDFEGRLRNLASKIDDVVFAGYVDSLGLKKLLYKNCLALVVPSLYEGLPMVILEAMAFSKAVIASNVGGIPLLIRHGKNGFLVKPGDSKDLEKFVRILLEDPDLSENMGSFGRKLAEEKFTVDKMASETLSVYDSLVKSPKTCA